MVKLGIQVCCVFSKLFSYIYSFTLLNCEFLLQYFECVNKCFIIYAWGIFFFFVYFKHDFFLQDKLNFSMLLCFEDRWVPMRPELSFPQFTSHSKIIYIKINLLNYFLFHVLANISNIFAVIVLVIGNVIFHFNILICFLLN